VAWIKLDDGFTTHPKIVGLSDKAFRAYVDSLCYSGRHLTDGFVPVAALSAASKKARPELEAAGLWHPDDAGIRINDFLEYNRSREVVEEERKRKSEGGKRGAQARWGDSSADNTSHGISHSSPMAEPKADANGSSMLQSSPVPTSPEVRSSRTVFNGSRSELPGDKASELARLLDAIGDHADIGTQGVLASLALTVPFGALAKVRESLVIQKPRNRAAYAVAALQSEAGGRT
jgi:hypothetical protein